MLLELLAVSLLLAASADAVPPVVLAGEAVVVHPGLVSTSNTEIRITFSPDGKRMLWGTIGWPGGPGEWDIWESVEREGKWQEPHPAAFNSSYKDFDPFFAPDSSGVFFFSNRPGGAGGDDIYFVAFDARTETYGVPVNLGTGVNSKGDEWAPSLDASGTELLFASDGRGGLGLHDLFVSVKTKDGWGEARALSAPLNSAEDDFDATWLHDGHTLVFSRKPKDREEMHLFASSRLDDDRWSEPVRLPATVNVPGGWNLGPSIDRSEPGVLYFTSHRDGASQGRLDIYRIRYAIGEGER
ncbi:MAG: PD40 domain-containing protein [Acidobacteria bacterium]|nr:PD40 domain-containing protein [Acidobacteriota bacterium]